MDEDLEHWMGKLSVDKMNLPISQLALPGSHDSGSFWLDSSGPLAPDESKAFKYFKGVVHNWSITQDLDFCQQLNIGIRYFDMRIAFKRNTKNFYVVHGLYGKEITPLLCDIKTFLDHHPSEVVILDFNHLYLIEGEENEKLIKKISDCFGDKLANRKNSFKNLSLSDMMSSQKQVIVFYKSIPDSAKYPFLWPENLIKNPWPEKTKLASLMQYLSSRIIGRNPNECYVTQGILTPDGWSIAFNLCSNLEKWQSNVKKSVTQWIEKENVAPKLNIVFVDFVDDAFTKAVINCNFTKCE